MTETLTPEAELHGTFKVDQGGKRYEVEFLRGRPFQVRVRMRKTRYGSTYRCLFFGGYQGQHVGDLAGRAAEVVSYVTNPAQAQRAGARVRSPAQIKAKQEAYADDFRRRHEAYKAQEAREKRFAEAAPDMHAALKALVAAIEAEGDTGLYAGPYRAAKAALAVAAGVNKAAA